MSPSRRASRATALLIVTWLTAGCYLAGSQVSSRTWNTATLNEDGSTTTVNVSTDSDRIQDIEFEPEDANLKGVAIVPGQPNKLDIAWTGGACDAQTDIVIADAGAGLAVTVAVKPDDRGCDAIGVGKAIRITLAQPVPPGMVTVRQ